MTQAMNRIRVALNLSEMSDADLLRLVVAIAALAPKSALMSIAAISTSVAAIGTKGAAFKTADDTVTADEEKLKNDKAEKVNARGTLVAEVESFAGLVSANAQTPADVTGMALDVRSPRIIATAAVETPTSIDVLIPKNGHGRCKATVHETGTTRGKYVAEWCPDPIGSAPWASLPGTGKSRTITGQSGTKVWVRFARVRGQSQSPFCTPVLITIP